MNDHFARVTPIVGTTLATKHVGVIGMPTAAPLVEYLAASGICHWWLDGPTTAQQALADQLHARHGTALNAQLEPWQLQAPIDVLVVVGPIDYSFPGVPQVHIQPPTAHTACTVTVIQAEQPNTAPQPILLNQPVDQLRWLRAAPLAAAIIRTVLLQHSAYTRADFAHLWANGQPTLIFEHPHYPGRVWSDPGQVPPVTTAAYTPPAAPRGTLLVAGLGSLGSEAVMQLAPYVKRLIIADPDTVEASNPVRQAFPLAAIGSNKATALAAQLQHHSHLEAIALPYALDATTTRHVLHEWSLDAALVVTGSDADFDIARELYNANVPHLVGRCYPRARYWEAMLIAGGPAFEALRGHLRLGPVPAPTPEQHAAYSAAGALEAEPATLIESGWAANWMSSLVRELSLPAGLRSRYILEWLHSEHVCILGGLYVEATAYGVAYNIAQPGEVHAWPTDKIKKTLASPLQNLPQQPYIWRNHESDYRYQPDD